MAVSLEFQVQTRLLTKQVGEAIKGATHDGIKLFTEAVAGRAKELVPVQSGILRDSIKASVRKARNEDRIIANVSTNTKGKAKTRKARADVKSKRRKLKDLEKQEKIGYGYGVDVEIGRASIGQKYKNTPYLRPALAEMAPKMPAILKAAVMLAANKQRIDGLKARIKADKAMARSEKKIERMLNPKKKGNPFA